MQGKAGDLVYLTPRQYCERFRCSRASVYRWIRDGRLRHKLIGRCALRIIVQASDLNEIESSTRGDGPERAAPGAPR